MATQATKRAVEVTYVETEDARNRTTKTYHYFVPDCTTVDLKPGDLVVVKSGTAGFMHLAKIEAVLDGSNRAGLASRQIVGTVDMSHYIREQQRRERRTELLNALSALEHKRQQQIRYAELTATMPEAAPLIEELASLE